MNNSFLSLARQNEIQFENGTHTLKSIGLLPFHHKEWQGQQNVLYILQIWIWTSDLSVLKCHTDSPPCQWQHYNPIVSVILHKKKTSSNRGRGLFRDVYSFVNPKSFQPLIKFFPNLHTKWRNKDKKMCNLQLKVVVHKTFDFTMLKLIHTTLTLGQKSSVTSLKL